MKQVLFALVAIIAASAAHAQSYLIKPGDSLRVEVLEDSQLNRDVLVLPDGRISLPLAGSIKASDRTTTQVERAIASRIAGEFQNTPTVYVAIRNVRGDGETDPFESDELIEIYFLGEISGPGPRKVKSGTTFLQAMSQNGGFTRFAAQKRVQLRRTDRRTGAQTVFNINYRDLANGAVLSKDIILRDGDVILVPERRLFE